MMFLGRQAVFEKITKSRCPRALVSDCRSITVNFGEPFGPNPKCCALNPEALNKAEFRAQS